MNKNDNYLTEEEKERLNELSDEEWKQEMQKKIEDLKNKQEQVSDKFMAMTNYNYLTDEKVKRIIKDGEPTVAQTVIYVFSAFAILSVIYENVGEVTKNLEWLIIFAVIIFLMVVIYVVEIPFRKKREKFANENFHKSSIFVSEFVSVGTAWGRRRVKYQIVFCDETGKKRRNLIPKEEYRRIMKERRQGKEIKTVHVLKYPRYKKGHRYMAFDSKEFVNKTTL